MFYFGDPAATAELMIQESVRSDGPGWPVTPLEYWSIKDSQAAMIYASSTLRRAVYETDDHEILKALCTTYEKYLDEFTQVDDVVYRAMKINEHQFPWRQPDAMARQKAIVMRNYKMTQVPPSED